MTRPDEGGYKLISDPSGDYVIGAYFYRADLPNYGPTQANLAWEKGTRWKKTDGTILEWDGFNMVKVKSS